MDLAIAIVGGVVGGVTARIAELAAARYSRHEQWIEPMRVAAAEVIGHYGVLRNSLVAGMLSGRKPAPYEEFFSPAAPLVAKLMTLPGTEMLIESRRAMAQAVREFHSAALTDDPATSLADHRQRSLDAMRGFEAAVRDLVANGQRMKRRPKHDSRR